MKPRYIALTLAVMAMLFITGCAKQYVSTATIQFQPSKPDDAENVLRALFPPQSKTVILRPIRNTELFQICVTDVDPQKAADEANRIADSLQSQVTASNPTAKYVIWERAEPMTRR